MRTQRIAVPTLVLAGIIGLSGCDPVVSSSPSKSSGGGSTSASSPSSESSSSSTGSSSSESSDSSSSSSSESSSSSPSSSSGGSSVSESDVREFATDHTVRACTIFDMDVISGGAEFCKSDTSSQQAGFKGQKLYFTTADKFDPNASYTYTATDGVETKDGKFKNDVGNSSDRSGAPMTLKFEVPMDHSGSYTATFKKNGTKIAEKTVDVTVN